MKNKTMTAARQMRLMMKWTGLAMFGLVISFFIFSQSARMQTLEAFQPDDAKQQAEQLAPQTGNRPDILWMRGGHRAEVSRTIYSPNGQYIATSPPDTYEYEVKVTRVSDGVLLLSVPGLPYGGFVNPRLPTFAFSPDSQTLAVVVQPSGTSAKEIQFLQISDGSLIRSIPVNDATNLAYSPDGTKLVAGKDIYNVANGTVFYTFPQLPTGEFQFASFYSPNGQYLYGYKQDSNGGLRILQWTSSNLSTAVMLGPNVHGSPDAISPNGQYVINGANGAGGSIIRATDGVVVTSVGQGVYSFSPNGIYLAVGREAFRYLGDLPTFKLFRTSDWGLVRTYTQDEFPNSVGGRSYIGLSFSPDSQNIAASFWDTRIWSVADGSLIRNLSTIFSYYSGVTSLAFTPDGQTLITASPHFDTKNLMRSNINFWNVADGSRRDIIFPQSIGLSINQLFVTPDGQKIITADNSNQSFPAIKIWDAINGTLLRSSNASQNALAVSPDGQSYAINVGEQIKIERVSDGSQIIRIGGINNGMDVPLVYSPNGQIIAAGRTSFGTFGGVKFWRVSDGVDLGTLSNSTGSISRSTVSSAFSPDGQIFAVGYELNTNPRGGEIKLWRVSDGAFLRTVITGFNNWIGSIAFSPNGQNIIATGLDATVRIYRVSDGALLQTYTNETSSPLVTPLYQVAFSPDGSRFAYGRVDATVVMARNPYSTTTTNYTISGNITRGGSALSGVAVAVSGSSASTATTDGSGNYSFTVAEGGSYTVTPSLAYNTFAPTSQSFNFIAANQTANFTATAITYTISGNLQADGANLQGATVSLTGSQSQTSTTDAAGNYSFTANAGGNYTVTVSKNGFTFNPANQTFNNLQANQTADFQNGVPLCTPPPNGLAAWYKAENDGNDSSGNGNNGNTSVTGFGQGFNGLALYQAGAQYMTVPDITSLSPSNITVDGWFRMTQIPASGNFYTLASKYGGDFRGWILRYRSDQTASFEVYRPSTGGAASSVTIPLNTWTHITGSYDGSTVKVYINGVLSGSGTFAGGYTPSTIPMQLGKASWTNGEYSYAHTDEFQIYNRTLSASEIGAIYNAGSAGVCQGATTIGQTH